MQPTSKNFAIAMCLLLVLAVAPATVHGQEDSQWYRATRLTVVEPIQVPGMVLEPGVYMMRLANTTDRHVIQIWDETSREMLTTFFGASDQLELPGVDDTANEIVLEFEETPAGTPDRIDTWTYAGQTTGLAFLYPDDQDQIVQSWMASQPGSRIADADTGDTEPAVAETVSPEPSEREEVAEAAAPPPAAQPVPQVSRNEPQPVPRTEEPETQTAPQIAQNQEQSQTDEAQGLGQNPGPTTLPRTATTLPLIGLLGIVSLTLGLLLRALPKKDEEAVS
jgi:hypothetical protein